MKIKAYFLVDALIIVIIVLMIALLVFSIKELKLNYQTIVEKINAGEELINLEYLDLEYYEN